ncbi:hypothetical protein [Chitinophaga sp. YIM B06452]|uniref:hypothetical protein n=1 Tax=Chitinophaga sp. YIM B06452 TaxID=3082158 RepID=UPI0031FEB394
MNMLKTDPSPFLVTDQQDYLLKNGFSLQVAGYNALLFCKDDMQVRIVNDVLILDRWQDGDEDNTAGFREEQRFNHISALDEVQWWFLLDAYGIVRIKDFAKSASRNDAIDFFVEMTKPFQALSS